MIRDGFGFFLFKAEFYTYEASFLNTWTVSAWTILFLPLYAAGCLLSGRMGPRKLATDIRESVLAFRDKGFTLGKTRIRSQSDGGNERTGLF